MEEKEKKKDKKKKRSAEEAVLGKKAKERIASFLAAKVKEEVKGKRGRMSEKTHQDKTSLGQVGKIVIFPHVCGAKLAVSTLQQKDCRKGRG